MLNSDTNYVLDAGAFYTGMVFRISKGYTTTQVYDEVRHIKKSFNLLETLVYSGNLLLLDPDMPFIEKVQQIAKSSGDITKLSIPDISILALSLQIEKAILVSDDYAVANIAKLLNIAVKPIATKGISSVRKYVLFCGACKKVYPYSAKECMICGNNLRKRFRKLKV